MQQSMEMMQEMLKSPLFDEYLNSPEKMEQSRQMILTNPLMKNMMSSLPGFDDILQDKHKFRETMIAAAQMYKNMSTGTKNDLFGFGNNLGGMNDHLKDNH